MRSAFPKPHSLAIVSPGRSGSFAANEVLRQEADGHTLFSIAGPNTAVPALLPNASFNLETDFAPVVHFATGYNVLVVNPKVPVNSVAELIAYLKQEPGKHTFSSGGWPVKGCAGVTGAIAFGGWGATPVP